MVTAGQAFAIYIGLVVIGRRFAILKYLRLHVPALSIAGLDTSGPILRIALGVG